MAEIEIKQIKGYIIKGINQYRTHKHPKTGIEVPMFREYVAYKDNIEVARAPTMWWLRGKLNNLRK